MEETQGRSPCEWRQPYTAGGQRVVQHDSTPAFTTTRVFIGDLYERFSQPFGTPPEHRYKILVGSRQVAEVSRSTSHPEQVLYLHDDHFGSVAVISDQDGSGGESRVYGTLGERVSGSGATGVLAAYTERGLGAFVDLGALTAGIYGRGEVRGAVGAYAGGGLELGVARNRSDFEGTGVFGFVDVGAGAGLNTKGGGSVSSGSASVGVGPGVGLAGGIGGSVTVVLVEARIPPPRGVQLGPGPGCIGGLGLTVCF